MTVFGIVILPKPTVPFGPTIVKDNVVVVVGWFDVIVALDICALVTFPLIASSTLAPLSVFADTVVANGVRVGDDVGDGVGVGVAVGLGVGVGAGVGVAVDEGDGVGVGANVAERVYEA